MRFADGVAALERILRKFPFQGDEKGKNAENGLAEMGATTGRARRETERKSFAKRRKEGDG
jgi:hypothetical protein